MSYREPNQGSAFVAIFLIGIIVGIIVGVNVNDKFWNKKLVKEGGYHWVIDENGCTNLVKKP